MIGPSGLLFISSLQFICSPSFCFSGGVAKKTKGRKTKFEYEKSFLQGHILSTIGDSLRAASGGMYISCVARHDSHVDTSATTMVFHQMYVFCD